MTTGGYYGKITVNTIGHGGRTMRQTDEKTTKTDTSCIERDFGAPGAEYRGVPFWAWNTNISQHHVESQTCMMRDMGFGGAVIHA